MSILIDPYMFELTDEQEIKNNIPFFEKIIKYSSASRGEKQLCIALYKGMVEKMQMRSIQPFPIQISLIEDRDLKDVILQINNSFNNMLLSSIESIDIDGCDGNQAFLVDEKEVEDEKYYELFSSLLIPCYSNDVFLDNKILTGRKKEGRHIGDRSFLTCRCDIRDYELESYFVDICDVVSQKDLAVDELKGKISAGEIKVVDVVEATMGHHHNQVQADKKHFQKLDDLSITNRRVLSLLHKLGLCKVIFGEFFLQDGSGIKGEMSIQNLEEKDTQDILIVKFLAETGMLIKTFLYFPKGIGCLLCQYFQNEQLTYKNVIELIEKVQ